MNDPSASETLTWLANGLKFDVLCCSGYEINCCLFCTKSRDDRSIVQNSGVTLEAKSMQFQLQMIKILLWDQCLIMMS